MMVVCLTFSYFAAAQDPKIQKSTTQVDALAKQKISELFSAVQHSDIGNIANDPAGTKAGLSYDVHMSDCENRWVALYHKAQDPDYTYGFVYIDPQAGFTLHYFGRFTIDADANYHVASNPLLQTSTV